MAELLPQQIAHKNILTAIQEKRFGDAERMAISALELYPQDTRLNIDYRNILTKTGRFEEVFAIVDRILADRPNDKHALFSKAYAEYEMRDYASAEKTVDHLLNIQPDHLFALGIKAQIYDRIDQPEKVLNTTRYILQLDETNWVAHKLQNENLHKVVKQLIDSKKPDEALAFLKPYQEKWPDNGRLYLLEALAHLKKHDYKKTLGAAHQGERLEPENPVFLGPIMEAHLGLGHYDTAIRMANKRLKEAPNDKYALGIKGRAEVKSGKEEDAVATWQKRLELEPDNHFHAGKLAQLYVRNQQYDVAEQLINTHLAADMDKPFVRSLLANIAMHQGEYEKAEGILSQLVEQDPTAIPFQSMRLQNMLINKGATEAAALADDLPKSIKDNPTITADIDCYLASDENEKAKSLLFKKMNNGTNYLILETTKNMVDAGIVGKTFLDMAIERHEKTKPLKPMQKEKLGKKVSREEAVHAMHNPEFGTHGFHFHNDASHENNGNNPAYRNDSLKKPRFPEDNGEERGGNKR